MKYAFIDPSGSFNEGKGHTGISIIDDFNWDTLKTYSLAAKDYTDRHLYWEDIIMKIVVNNCDFVVIESFVVRGNGFLIGKMPETSLFIGALIWELEQYGIKYTFQSPSQAKARFKDEYLGMYIPSYEVKEQSGKNYYYLNGKITNDHVRDSLKHLLYFMKYGRKKICVEES